VDSKPTWRNKRSGSVALAKRLDKFIVSNWVLTKIGRYKAWVGMEGSSNYQPILLQLDSDSKKHPSAGSAIFKNIRERERFGSVFYIIHILIYFDAYI
jgi:hypothetical protein